MLRSAFAALLVFSLPACVHSSETTLDGFPRASLSIATASARVHRFDIWLARTPEQQTRGLMFVTELGADRGMLFVQEPLRAMSMWMKNTLIPLDMLFIAADGRILYIKERATPQSTALIGYPQPVRAVLELRGGEASARGIHVGDRVAGSWFSPEAALRK